MSEKSHEVSTDSGWNGDMRERSSVHTQRSSAPMPNMSSGIRGNGRKAAETAQGLEELVCPSKSQTSNCVIIIVYGSPAAQGSKRFVGIAKTTGRGIMVEMSKKVAPWRQDVKAAAELVRAGAEPIDAPLTVRMVFTMPKPASAPKRRRTWPMRTPDLSKLCRSTEDALTQAGVWRDDARVVEYDRLAKVFPNEDPEALSSPGVRIEIRRLEDAPQQATLAVA
jgi:crossover junction endodeoxyribonuclease RusA